MKLKKVFAAVAAMAVAASALSAMSLSASAVTAGATSIDFEDGDYSFVYMAVDSGADASILSVEKYNGSKQLKVDVQDKTLIPKVWFDLKSVMDVDQYTQIYSIELDLTIVPKNASDYVGWAGGAFGGAGSWPGNENPEWNQSSWEGSAYNPGEAATIHCTKMLFLTSQQYTVDSVNPFFGLMRWSVSDGGEYYMYIDNIVFKNKAGDTLTLSGTTATTTAATTTATVTEATTAAITTAAVTEATTAATTTAAVTEATTAATTTATVTEATTAATTTAAVTEATTAATTPYTEGTIYYANDPNWAIGFWGLVHEYGVTEATTTTALSLQTENIEVGASITDSETVTEDHSTLIASVSAITMVGLAAAYAICRKRKADEKE